MSRCWRWMAAARRAGVLPQDHCRKRRTIVKRTGVLMMEIGYDQKDAVKELLRESGRFEKIVGLTDLTGKDRIVAATVIAVK